MTAKWKRAAMLLAVGPLLATACCPDHRPVNIVPLTQIIERHNANAAQVPRLWARARIRVTFLAELESGVTVPVTWGSTSELASPNGLLLMAKGPDPLGQHDFVLIGRETAAMELFRLGASLEEGVYYFWYAFGGSRGAYWGRNDRADAMVGRIPINPHDLLAVLNVSMMPHDLTKLPAVAMTMRTTPGDYAYVVSRIDRNPVTGQIMFRRETLYRWSDDHGPGRPFEMNFFDANGLRIMTAKLSNYKLIAADPPAKTQVTMPTDIEITWPEIGSSMHIVLSERSTKQVSPAVFRYSDHAPDLLPEEEIQIDAEPPTEEPTP